MRAHQIMTRNLVTTSPDATVDAAARLMLDYRLSGLPVLDGQGRLVGIVSESDFIRRSEIGTRQRHARWIEALFGRESSAYEFVREHGRLVRDIMSPDVVLVHEDNSLQDVVELMDARGIRRLPVVRGDALLGIITRSDLMRTVAGMCHEIPDPTADDEHIRNRIIRVIEANNWQPIGLRVSVRKGVVHLYGMIIESDAREANLVAARNVSGVKEVHDHLALVESWSGLSVPSPEDIAASQAESAAGKASQTAAS